jgi:hypothetical protein
MNKPNWNDHFEYDETSPTGLRWKQDRPYNSRRGQVAGTKGAKYWEVRVCGSNYYCHHIIWEMFNGPIPKGMEIDHEDRDRTHNKIVNFRAVTHAHNCHNSSMRCDNTSGIVGVRRRVIRIYVFWMAHWTEYPSGASRQRFFSTRTHGEQWAFWLAREWRRRMIEEQNKNGARYSEAHGKEKKPSPFWLDQPEHAAWFGDYRRKHYALQKA